jgi:hypothetical protein
MWKSVVAALVFVAFVPGVLTTLPSKSSKRTTVLLVHALLFAFVLHLVMRSCYFAESFANVGPASCPAGYVEGMKGDKEECIPLPGTRQNPPSSMHVKK